MTIYNEPTYSSYPHSGELKLAVVHHRATQESAPHILFCGGFHSAMQGTKALALQTHCLDNNWHYTRFDYRGHGQSDGDAAGFTLEDWLEDTLAVMDAQAPPCILVGSSMGAWLATLAALRRPARVQALMLLAAAPDFLTELVRPKLSAAHIWDLQQGQAVDLANDIDNPYPITQALLDSAADHLLLNNAALQQLHCPIRLLHGTADTDVPFDLSVRLMAQLPASHDARLTLLHDADHRLSDKRSLTYIKQELTSLVQHIKTSE